MAWEKQEGATFWNPENEGDELIGTVAAVRTEGEYGLQYDIKDEKGDVIRTPSHKVLQNRMANAKEGTKVKIVYTGEEPPAVKGRKPTKMYDVFFDK